MTWESVSAIAKTAWHAVLIVGLLFALVLLARACDGERGAKAELLRVQEQVEIRVAGLELIEGAEQVALQLKLDEAKKGSSDFAEALAKAQAALKTRPTIVVRASTGPVPVETPEDPDPPTKPDGLPAERPCMLRPGEQGEIAVTEAVLETEAGNRVLVGAAEAFRVDPPPRTRLFHGTFKAEVTEANGEPLPLESSLGWGGAVLAGYGTTGASGMVQGFTPPLIWRLGLTGAVTAGPGVLQFQGGIVYR